MDPLKAKQLRMARETNIVSESHTVLNEEYEIVLNFKGKITETGLLVVAELKPKKATGRPSFLLRWDEKADHLNVDPINARIDQIKDFKKGVTGYRGHLPIRSSSKFRLFHSTIRWDNQILYDGHITIPLKFEAGITVKIGISAIASVELLRSCKICGKRFKVAENETTCPDCSA